MTTGPLFLVMAGRSNGHVLWLMRFRLDIKKKKIALGGDHIPGTGHPERW